MITSSTSGSPRTGSYYAWMDGYGSSHTDYVQQNVTIPAAFGRTQRLQIGDDEVGIEAISERVKQALATRDDKSVFIRMDGMVTAQDFVSVTDRLKEAGVEKVGFMTQPEVR